MTKKYKVRLFTPDGNAETLTADYIAYENRILTFKVGGLTHETSLPWLYWEVDSND